MLQVDGYLGTQSGVRNFSDSPKSAPGRPTFFPGEIWIYDRESSRYAWSMEGKTVLQEKGIIEGGALYDVSAAHGT